MRLKTLRIAWRNLGRNRRRTVLAVAAIALGQIVVVSINGLMAGFYGDMMETITGPLVGHVQIHHPDWQEERAIDLTVEHLAAVRAAIQALPEVKSASPRIYAAVLSASGERTDRPADAEAAVIVGVDVDVESADAGLLEGLAPDQRPGRRGVVLGRVLADRLGAEPGQQIAVIGQDADEFPVSDLFDVKAVIRGRVDLVNRMGVVMSLGDAQALLALTDQAHEIVVRADDPRRAEALADQVRRIGSLAGARVLPWRQAVPELAGLVDMKAWFDLIFVAILFVAAAAGIANTMMMSTFERTREFGMLLALGARPRRVVWMVVMEAVVLGLLGVAVGSALGTGIVLITSRTGIDYAAFTSTRPETAGFWGMNVSFVTYPKFEFRHVLLGLAAVTLTSVLAALWPAAGAARLQPAEAMRP